VIEYLLRTRIALPERPSTLPAKYNLKCTEYKTNGAKQDSDCCVDVGCTSGSGGVGDGGVGGAVEHCAICGM
jgi:hypothetical protein